EGTSEQTEWNVHVSSWNAASIAAQLSSLWGGNCTKRCRSAAVMLSADLIPSMLGKDMTAYWTICRTLHTRLSSTHARSKRRSRETKNQRTTISVGYASTTVKPLDER